MLRRRIGEVFKERRKELGYTLDRVAQISGITQQSLWRIEAGQQNFTVDVLEGLCKALDLPLAELANRTKGGNGRGNGKTPKGAARGAAPGKARHIDEVLAALAAIVQKLEVYKHAVYGQRSL